MNTSVSRSIHTARSPASLWARMSSSFVRLRQIHDPRRTYRSRQRCETPAKFTLRLPFTLVSMLALRTSMRTGAPNVVLLGIGSCGALV